MCSPLQTLSMRVVCLVGLVAPVVAQSPRWLQALFAHQSAVTVTQTLAV